MTVLELIRVYLCPFVVAHSFFLFGVCSASLMAAL